MNRHPEGQSGTLQVDEIDDTVSSFSGEMLRGSGWQYLLDLRRNEAVLCYDCAEGATSLLLAGLYRSVTVIHRLPAEIDKMRRRLSGEVRGELQYCVAAEAADLAGLPQASFSGMVIHDPAATLANQSDRALLAKLLSCAYPLIKPGGYVYLGMCNRYSYVRLRPGTRDGAWRAAMSVAAGKAVLGAAGFTQLSAHPFLLEGTQLAEVIPRRGYRSMRNHFSLREKFKERVLGRWGSRWFASGYGLIAHTKGGGPPASTLGRLLQGALPSFMSLSHGLELKSYLLLNWGKVLLSVGQGASRHGEYVIVLTGTPHATERRRREAEILKALKARRLSVDALIPRFLGEFELDAARCFVLQEFPGVTLDRAAPRLGRLLAYAVDFLARFHAETATPRVIDDGAYGRIFGELFRKAGERHPAVGAQLKALEAAVRRVVLGKQLPLVWIHGDFKIDNLVFDERSRGLVGVIDWEHSQEEGLPLLDLLYLLLFNRNVAAGADLLSALNELVLRGPQDDERRLLQRYAGVLSPDSALLPALQAMFFVHHIGVRFQYLLDSDAKIARLRDMLGVLERIFPPAAVARS